jgi:hypothetical protein
MFRPNWPSSGVQVVMVQDSSAHCNVVFFPPIVVASGYFGYVGYHWFYFGVLGLHVVAFGFVWFVGCRCLECSCWGGSSGVLVGRHSRSLSFRLIHNFVESKSVIKETPSLRATISKPRTIHVPRLRNFLHECGSYQYFSPDFKPATSTNSRFVYKTDERWTSDSEQFIFVLVAYPNISSLMK